MFMCHLVEHLVGGLKQPARQETRDFRELTHSTTLILSLTSVSNFLSAKQVTRTGSSMDQLSNQLNRKIGGEICIRVRGRSSGYI